MTRDERIESFLEGLMELRNKTGCRLAVSQNVVDFVMDVDGVEEAWSVQYITTAVHSDPETGKVERRGISMRLSHEWEAVK